MRILPPLTRAASTLRARQGLLRRRRRTDDAFIAGSVAWVIPALAKVPCSNSSRGARKPRADGTTRPGGSLAAHRILRPRPNSASNRPRRPNPADLIAKIYPERGCTTFESSSKAVSHEARGSTFAVNAKRGVPTLGLQSQRARSRTHSTTFAVVQIGTPPLA